MADTFTPETLITGNALQILTGMFPGQEGGAPSPIFNHYLQHLLKNTDQPIALDETGNIIGDISFEDLQSRLNDNDINITMAGMEEWVESDPRVIGSQVFGDIGEYNVQTALSQGKIYMLSALANHEIEFSFTWHDVENDLNVAELELDMLEAGGGENAANDGVIFNMGANHDDVVTVTIAGITDTPLTTEQFGEFIGNILLYSEPNNAFDVADVPIPGTDYTFGQMNPSQQDRFENLAKSLDKADVIGVTANDEINIEIPQVEDALQKAADGQFHGL